MIPICLNASYDNELVTIVTNLELLACVNHRHPVTLINILAKYLGTTANSLFLRGFFTQTQVWTAFNKFTTRYVVCPKCQGCNTKLDMFQNLCCFHCDNPSIIRSPYPFIFLPGETLEIASLPEIQYTPINKSLSISVCNGKIYATNNTADEVVIESDTPFCILRL